MSEWLKEAVCKTAGASLRWFESNLTHRSERDGIGIHKTLKMSRPIGLAGSSPAARTKEKVKDDR